MPPAPKSIQRKMFLLVPNPHLPHQDYCLKEQQRTLAYAQALQYWAEKANPGGPNEPHHLVMCVHELRQILKPYMTFSDHNVFEGLTCKTSEAGAEETMQPNPTESTLSDDPATLMTVPSALVDESATLITTPSKPAEESITLITTPAVLVDGPADPTTLPEATNDVGKLKIWSIQSGLKSILLIWWPPWGESPTLGDLRSHHHYHSSSWRRAWCHLVEEKWSLKGDSSSALPWSSPEPTCYGEENPGAQPKVLSPGFRDCQIPDQRQAPSDRDQLPSNSGITRPVDGVHSGHCNHYRSVPRANHMCCLPDHSDDLHGGDEFGDPTMAVGCWGPTLKN